MLKLNKSDLCIIKKWKKELGIVGGLEPIVMDTLIRVVNLKCISILDADIMLILVNNFIKSPAKDLKTTIDPNRIQVCKALVAEGTQILNSLNKTYVFNEIGDTTVISLK